MRLRKFRVLSWIRLLRRWLLFRRTPGSNAGSVDLSIGDHPASAVDGAKQKFEGQGIGRCGDKTALGPEHPGNGSVSGCCSAIGRQYSMDDRPRERVPGPTIRRDRKSVV